MQQSRFIQSGLQTVAVSRDYIALDVINAEVVGIPTFTVSTCRAYANHTDMKFTVAHFEVLCFRRCSQSVSCFYIGVPIFVAFRKGEIHAVCRGVQEYVGRSGVCISGCFQYVQSVR